MVARDFERARDLFLRALDGTPLEHELLTIVNQTGRETRLDVCAFPVLVKEQIAGVWGLASEVGTPDRRDEAHTRSQELLLQLTDNISEVFYLSSVDYGQVIFVSPAYEDIWGRSVESLHANPISRFQHIHSEDRESVRAALLKHRISSPFEIEYRVVRPGGSVRWVRERGFPVPGDDGEIVRVAGTISDITERKFLEEQLLQSQKMESIGRLAGGIAHDFNNLLMVVLNSARFVHESLNQNDPARIDVENILEAGERGADLVRQLLTYSRKQIVRPKVVNVNDLILEISAMLDRTIGEDVQLTSTLAVDLGDTRIDPNQFVQLMLNVAVNARDSMPRGGMIGIETRNVKIASEFPGNAELKSGSYVCIAVSDTGHGMSRDVSAQIFEPFFTTKPKAEATGLGLSTVYGIVTQADGHVSVYSEKGVGSTFKIYLPAVQREDSAELRLDQPFRRGQGETILVAEDDEAVRATTSKILERHGYLVLHASSGSHALDRADEHSGQIRLLLTDVVMPGMSGRELASHMKIKRPDTEILYMSGYTADMIGRHGVLSNHENYIQKPFTADELLRKLEELLADPS
jgi:PAS domain S-box-containing protein